MEIAFVSLRTTRHRDTAGARRFERVARLLSERGHEVTFFCGQWWDDYTTEFVEDGIRYRGVTLGTARSSFLTRLPALLAHHRPDIVHVRETPAQQMLAALSGARMARAPLVIEWFGDETVAGRTVSVAARNADCIITPSELVWTDACERSAPPERTRTIPESIDISKIEAVEPTSDVDIVYAHPLNAHAHLDDLLLGLAELRTRDWQAVIIGDGPRREEYEYEVGKLRIDDRVRFAGELDRAERLELYRGAHVFVHTAGRTQFATELLWALACGCLGIVEYQTDSSAHELVENYGRGFRVANPRELSGAISEAGGFERLTYDDHWSQFDHDAVIEQYIDAYRELY